ncbi:hypothetical protein B0G73_11287 [Paraburkholderia sp. BL25I1N1]|nr:hypothetical protein B0G73_11287 [Paraburkholderia sp. BL25I1N1]
MRWLLNRPLSMVIHSAYPSMNQTERDAVSVNERAICTIGELFNGRSKGAGCDLHPALYGAC